MKSKFNIVKIPFMVLDLLTEIYHRTIKNKNAVLLVKISLVSILLSSFNSCEYPLDEEYNRQSFSLNDSIVGLYDEDSYLDVDTLYFTPGQNMQFALRFKTESSNYFYRIYSVEFFLNSDEFEPNNPGGSYTSNFGITYNYTMPDSVGIYDINAKIYCTVKTGNIANISDHEKYLYEKRWVLIIYQLENESPSYVNHYFENRSVKIKWEDFPYSFIKSCKISHSYFHDYTGLIGISEYNSIMIGNKIVSQS